MAYTASLLSFMLENLNKTVVLTGSQIPISELRNDAIDNLLGSLIVAGTFLIPEVIIYFDNKVLRGNRTTKHDSSMLAAFGSPNCDPLATLDTTFLVSWERVLKYHSGKFSVFTNLEKGISFLTMSPCMHIETVKLVMSHSKAVIIAGYGMGNLPSNDKDLMACLAEAVSNNVIVVIKTQCFRGTVNDLYECGRVLIHLGCVLANDMTLECIFAKLSYLLGKGFNTQKVKTMMNKNMLGELTSSSEKEKAAATTNDLVVAVANEMNVKDYEEIHDIGHTILPILCNTMVHEKDLAGLKLL